MSIATAAVIATALVSTAAAAQPDVVTLTNDVQTNVLTDICRFAVTITSTGSGTLRFFTDKAGDLRSLNVDVLETNTFSANGTTLVGKP